MPHTVWILALAQALAFCTAPLVVFVGSLVGRSLAPDPSWATLPVALEVVGTAIGVVPLTLLMRRFGRKVVMVSGAVGSAAAALACAWAVNVHSFIGFCLGTAALGAALAVVQQYRFAAIELVPAEQAGDAAARVLLVDWSPPCSVRNSAPGAATSGHSHSPAHLRSWR